jgi:PTH2 family peptidyl-tRNA hydrolase
MSKYAIKQYILIDKSLNMGRGKQVAQGAHASLKVFFDRMRLKRRAIIDGPSLATEIILNHEIGGLSDEEYERKLAEDAAKPFVTRTIYECVMTDEMAEWKDGAFAKITLSAPDGETIKRLCEYADHIGVPSATIFDNGVTQVDPGTLTAGAIGPFDTTNESYKRLVDELSKLKLL